MDTLQNDRLKLEQIGKDLAMKIKQVKNDINNTQIRASKKDNQGFEGGITDKI